MTSMSVRDLVVGYGGPPVVRGATIDVPSGTLLAVVGASGSGKTTLLRAIAGFVPITSGTVALGDRVLDGGGTHVPPERRGIGIVTQDGSLFPHLSVARNVGFGLPRRRTEDGVPTQQRVAELLAMVGLTEFADRSPHELSGGQQQRVALARALAPRPEVVLLDEPFSALDAGLRVELGREVRDVLAATGTTAVLVTHDQDEALSLADSVALMVDGRIVQEGTPEQVYQQPRDAEVAGFLGEIVLLPAWDAADGSVMTALGRVPCEGTAGADARIALRPEQLTLQAVPGGGSGIAEGVVGEVVHVDYHGHDSIVDVRLPDADVRVRVLGASGVRPGNRVGVGVRGEGRLL